MSELRYKSDGELRRMKDAAGEYWCHSNVLLRWAKDDEVRAIEDELRRRRMEEAETEKTERRKAREQREEADLQRQREEEFQETECNPVDMSEGEEVKP